MTLAATLILLIFIVAFVLILGEFVHRTLAAWGGAVAMLIVGKIYGTLDWCSGHGSNHCEHNFLSSIYFNVIWLLLVMMIFA